MSTIAGQDQVSIIIAIEALLLLLPATLLYFGGMTFAILAFFAASKDGVTPAFLAIAALLLLPGYGPYSLWWLVVRHRNISPHEIPRIILGGAITGGLVALIFIFPFILSGLTPPTPFISKAETLTTMLVFGGGPLLVAITLLVIMQSWRRKF